MERIFRHYFDSNRETSFAGVGSAPEGELWQMNQCKYVGLWPFFKQKNYKTNVSNR